ncbi:cupin domain-containing protein [Psychrobacter sp.]|uniref:cupin domain-containing protein n=1 Tax=Psychrobacter sp. TaxID=56811 RepID=UPI0025F19A84|nr:cupin domain-containing protein [Psychrobacter sp.]
MPAKKTTKKADKQQVDLAEFERPETKHGNKREKYDTSIKVDSVKVDSVNENSSIDKCANKSQGIEDQDFSNESGYFETESLETGNLKTENLDNDNFKATNLENDHSKSNGDTSNDGDTSNIIMSSDKNEAKADDIGKKIKQLRLTRGYSQRKLATLAGLTNTSISSIERNKVSPAVNTLKSILEVLGSDLATFFSDEWQEPKPRVVVTPENLVELSEPNSKVSLKQVYSGSTTKNLGFLIETYQPNSATEDKIVHEGEEIGTVIEGKIIIRIEEDTYLLNEGDSYVIDTMKPHTFINPCDTVTRIVSAHTPTTY